MAMRKEKKIPKRVPTRRQLQTTRWQTAESLRWGSLDPGANHCEIPLESSVNCWRFRLRNCFACKWLFGPAHHWAQPCCMAFAASLCRSSVACSGFTSADQRKVIKFLLLGPIRFQRRPIRWNSKWARMGRSKNWVTIWGCIICRTPDWPSWCMLLWFW